MAARKFCGLLKSNERLGRCTYVGMAMNEKTVAAAVRISRACAPRPTRRPQVLLLYLCQRDTQRARRSRFNLGFATTFLNYYDGDGGNYNFHVDLVKG